MQGIQFGIPFIQTTLEVEDADYAGKIDPLIGQFVDQVQPVDVSLGIHAGIPAGTLGRDQALLLVCTKGLGMDARQFGCDADHIQGTVPVVHYHGLAF